jgi:hypothetical protein
MSITDLRGAIVVSTYSRPLEFQILVKTIFENSGHERLEKIFLVQDSNQELINIIESARDSRTSIFSIPAPSAVPLVNINLNRWNSQVIAFDIFQCDWVIALEEDVEIDKDTVTFVSAVFARFCDNKHFRAINLGSYEVGARRGQYSILNQGLHGQASAIPKATWEKIKSKIDMSDLNSLAYDWLVEPIVRSGFVIVPNSSYFKDNGWSKPTHAPNDPNDVHYLNLNNSYTSKDSTGPSDILHIQVEHEWPNSKVFQYSDFFRYLVILSNLWKFSRFRLWLHRRS